LSFTSPNERQIVHSDFESGTGYINIYDQEVDTKIESPNPYPDNYNNTWTINHQDASRMRVHFSWYDIRHSLGLGYTDYEKNYNIESPHPYPDDYYNQWTITEPGAERIRVHFNQIDTESGYDDITISDQYNYTVDVFSGIYYNEWSDWVDGDTILIEFVSDSSGTGDGFVIDKYEYSVINPGSEDQIFIINETGGKIETIYGNYSYENYSWGYDGWSNWVDGDTIHIRLVSDDSESGNGFLIDRYEYDATVITYSSVRDYIYIINEDDAISYSESSILLQSFDSIDRITFFQGINEIDVYIPPEIEEDMLIPFAVWGLGDVADPDLLADDWICLGGPGNFIELHKKEDGQYQGFMIIPGFMPLTTSEGRGQTYTLFAGAYESFGDQYLVKCNKDSDFGKERPVPAPENGKKIGTESLMYIISGAVGLVLFIVLMIIIFLIIIRKRRKSGKLPKDKSFHRDIQKGPVNEFTRLDGVDEYIAREFKNMGYTTFKELKSLNPNDLKGIKGMSRERARTMFRSLNRILQEDDIINEFMRLEGVDQQIARLLMDMGCKSLSDLKSLDPNKLKRIKGMSRERARTMFRSLNRILEEEGREAIDQSDEEDDWHFEEYERSPRPPRPPKSSMGHSPRNQFREHDHPVSGTRKYQKDYDDWVD